MRTYLENLNHILQNGDQRMDRTGVGTLSVFGLQQRYNLAEGFPAVTTKKLAWNAVLSELLWFIEGSGDERRLAEILHGDRNSPKPTIWTDNANATYWAAKAKYEGDLGRVYGVQWRSWRTPTTQVGVHAGTPVYEVVEVDQLKALIDGIKKDPYGRRHILSAWNPGELNSMALPPCHTFAQFYVSNYNQNDVYTAYFNYRDTLSTPARIVLDSKYEGTAKTVNTLRDLNLPTQKLSCQMYQRSADMFLGVPFNIASYSLFTHMIAQVCGLGVGDFIHTLGDAHIYLDHVDAVKEQLTREPLALPKLWINPAVKDIDSFKMEDFKLINYTHLPTIKAKMAV